MKDWPAILLALAIIAVLPATILWAISGMTFFQSWALTTIVLVTIGVIDR